MDDTDIKFLTGHPVWLVLTEDKGDPRVASCHLTKRGMESEFEALKEAGLHALVWVQKSELER